MQNKARLRSTVSAVIAVLVMFGPDIVDAFSVTDASPKWFKMTAKVVGLLIGFATTGKAIALLNKFLPETPTNTAAVIPVAPMQTGDAPAKVLPKQGETL